MFARFRRGGGLSSMAWALAPAISLFVFFSGSPVLANDGPQSDDGIPGTPLAVTGAMTARENSPVNGLGLSGPFDTSKHGRHAIHAWLWEEGVAFEYNRHGALAPGALGWGFGKVVPGFYGFDTSWFLGYGYGGRGLGVGAYGGYPFYGGPGYPCGGQIYDGGPAYHGQPNPLIRPSYAYEGPGLVAPFNVGMGPEARARADSLAGPGRPYYGYNSTEGAGGPYHAGFGPFTGSSAYPFIHPTFTAEAAAKGTVFDPFSDAGASPYDAPTTNAPAVGFGYSLSEAAPVPAGPIKLPAQGRYLGIDEEPVTDADGARAIRVAKVYPGTVAEKAGLHPGDVIYSINGYLTTQRGNLAWIIVHAAPKNVLTMKVLTAADGKEHTITAQLPTIEPAPVDTTRPPYLPPVGNGPPPASR